MALEDFKKAIATPEGQAALLQFGLGALQPAGFGQTTGGHLARAIGAGGEAAQRVGVEDVAAEKREADEAARKTALGFKGRQVTSGEKRAEAAQTSATAALRRANRLDNLTLSQALGGRRSDQRAFQSFLRKQAEAQWLTDSSRSIAELMGDQTFIAQTATQFQNIQAGAPATQRIPAAAATATPATPAASKGPRVREKASGRFGHIVNDIFVPE